MLSQRLALSAIRTPLTPACYAATTTEIIADTSVL
jgi:hypothetical protein